MSPSPGSVAEVHEAVQGYLAGVIRRGALVWAGVGLAAVFTVAWLLVGSDGWNSGSALPLVLDLACAVMLGTVFVGYRRIRGRTLDERSVSRAMEEASGLSDGVLQGALELQRSVPGGVSSALAARSQGAVLASMAPGSATPAGLAGRLGAAVKEPLTLGTRVLAILAVLLVTLGIASPRRALSAWSGLARPVGTLLGPALPPLGVHPGDAEVPRGDAVELRISAPLRQEVEVHWQARGDVARSRRLQVSSDSASITLPDVSASVSYWVVAPDGARSPVHTLTPVDPLFVTDVTVRLVFPAYLQRPEEEFRGEVPELELPAGTEVVLEGRASRPLGQAELTLDGAVATDLLVDGPGFMGTLRPNRSGSYEWRFRDAGGAPAQLTPGPLLLTVVPDAAPEVRIALPAPDTLLPARLRQPLVLEARDDHGLRSLELVAWRVTALGDSLEASSQTVDLGGSPMAVARPLLDVSQWGLVPGDQVRYFARVRDIHPRGQSARTEVHVLRMPTPEALRREAGDELQEAAELLREMQEEAARAAEEARELERTSGAPDRNAQGERPGDGSSSFQEQEALREAAEGQQAMGARADSVADQLEALKESLQDAGAADPELDRDLEELQRLLEELGGTEMQEAMEELLSRMDEMGQREAQQTLEELARQKEEMRARLEEAVQRAQRAAAEQEFRTATDEARELAEEQEALAESMAQAAEPELRARQQEELAREAGELQVRMGELGETLESLGEEDALRELDQASTTLESAREGMEQAAQQAPASPREAAETAQEAANEMSEAAQQLQEAREQMMAERARAFQAALEQAAQDALALAREQGRTRDAMDGATREELAALRSQVAATEEGAESLARNLDLAARTAGADDRAISQVVGEALQSLARSRETLGGRAGGRPAPQTAADESVAALNQVAGTALAAIRSLQEGGSSAQPTPEQMMEQMEQMAQEQADVNNQAAQMMPMQLTPQAMEEMMQQMAQQQQDIASDLGQMSEQEGSEGPLGDVEAMAQEAEALAEALAGGRLDAETRERQERLFHRLLDAGRSLEKEEESTERESTAASEVERAEVDALLPGDLGLSQFRLPDAATLNRLPPAARALVLRYFQRLNRGGGG